MSFVSWKEHFGTHSSVEGEVFVPYDGVPDVLHVRESYYSSNDTV